MGKFDKGIVVGVINGEVGMLDYCITIFDEVKCPVCVFPASKFLRDVFVERIFFPEVFANGGTGRTEKSATSKRDSVVFSDGPGVEAADFFLDFFPD